MQSECYQRDTAARGRPYQGEGGETPTRWSDALQRAVHLLCGFADQLDESSATGISACTIKAAPREVDFCGETRGLRTLDH